MVGEICDCEGNILDECGVCNGSGPEENFDCAGNCIVDIDCAGDCAGSAEEDESEEEQSGSTEKETPEAEK